MGYMAAGHLQAQEAYDRALERVLRDLHATTSQRPDISINLQADELPYRYETRHASSLRGPAAGADEEEAVVVEVAALVQDDVLEDLWGPVWPRCPGHQHPADPGLHDGRAAWVCPTSGRPVAVVGDLKL
jgi:hypothetical protein